MSRIFSVDPGSATGFATYNSGEFSSWEVDVREAIHMCLEAEIPRSSVVVCESFHITRVMPEIETPIELIGAVKYVCDMHNVPLVMQTPSTRHFMSDDKLRALGWFKKTKDNHSNDAAKHLGTYCIRNRELVYEDLEKILGVLDVSE